METPKEFKKRRWAELAKSMTDQWKLECQAYKTWYRENRIVDFKKEV